MKQIISITTAILIFVCFSTVSAHADRKTMEGFMIGTGVAILGTAIINGINRDSRPHYTRSYSRHDGYRHPGYRYGYNKKHQRRYRPHTPRGYWQIEKIWIDPVYEKKWNPGHYNTRGEWVDGRNEKFQITNGYWQEEKVWVRH